MAKTYHRNSDYVEHSQALRRSSAASPQDNRRPRGAEKEEAILESYYDTYAEPFENEDV